MCVFVRYSAMGQPKPETETKHAINDLVSRARYAFSRPADGMYANGAPPQQ